jgi:SAM-dependent methyltransferase
VVGIDINPEQARLNLSSAPRITVEEADLLGDLKPLGSFDFIYCQEVLHHTSDPFGAFQNLVNILAPGGEIAIYVYRRKEPTREWVDDYVRDKIADLDYPGALEQLTPVTELGRVLAEQEVEVDVPDVPILGIEGDKYDLQRFIYHFSPSASGTKHCRLKRILASILIGTTPRCAADMTPRRYGVGLKESGSLSSTSLLITTESLSGAAKPTSAIARLGTGPRRD